MATYNSAKQMFGKIYVPKHNFATTKNIFWDHLTWNVLKECLNHENHNNG